MQAEQGSIFPEIKVIRAPRVVRVLCECIGDAAAHLSFLGTTPLASHGDHPKGDVRDEANQVAN